MSKKPLIFWRFPGIWKWKIGLKRVKDTISSNTLKSSKKKFPKYKYIQEISILKKK